MSESAQNEVLLRAVGGDRAALETLLATNYRGLSAFLAAKVPPDLRSTLDADDLVQETFADAARRIGDFRPDDGSSFFGWLATIAEHKLLDSIRAKRAAKRGGARQAMDLATSTVAQILEQVAVNTHTPSRSVARHDAVAAVQDGLQLLTPDYREALQLRYIQSLPVAEIAARMNRTERAVHMLCYRGLRELVSVIGPESHFFTQAS